MKTDVLRALGGPRPEFTSLDAAALEMGHRYIRQGAITRHIPWLVPDDEPFGQVELSIEDELRFVFFGFGSRWAYWAMIRAGLTGYRAPADLWHAWRRVVVSYPNRASGGKSLHCEEVSTPVVTPEAKVTVLIPTLERYAFLRRVLEQLRRQTVRPWEVILVDQTAPERRDSALLVDFCDLPLRVMYRERQGQCSARNAGLDLATGEYILFLDDDDDDIRPDLIERHLQHLARFDADASCGVATEERHGEPRPDLTQVACSHVFSTNNALVETRALRRAGLFDLAYEHGQGADADLGQRLYLSGATLMLNPGAIVFHHHARHGGLRQHNARTVGYSAGVKSLLARRLPTATEFYFALRYFKPAQVHEMELLRILDALVVRGRGLSPSGRVMRFFLRLLFLPHVLWKIRVARLQAVRSLRQRSSQVDHSTN